MVEKIGISYSKLKFEKEIIIDLSLILVLNIKQNIIILQKIKIGILYKLIYGMLKS